jgi:hypothetical protein
MPSQELGGAHLIRDAGARDWADVCAHCRLENAGGEVRVARVDVFGGEEAEEGVSEGCKLLVGRGRVGVGVVPLVEWDEGGVGTGLLED